MSTELVVHKCRFLDFVPSAIVSIDVSDDERYAAIGRENGNIEILDVKEYFSLIKVNDNHN